MLAMVGEDTRDGIISRIDRRRQRRRLRNRRYRARLKRAQRLAKRLAKRLEKGAESITTYDELVAYLVARRHALGWSQAELDQRAGFQDGYSAKLESWRGPQGKVAGAVIMPLWFAALGIALKPVAGLPTSSAATLKQLEKAGLVALDKDTGRWTRKPKVAVRKRRAKP